MAYLQAPSSHTLHAAFVVIYLVVLIGVGALKVKKIKTQEDFALAGRGLSTFVLVGTLLATWIGTGSIFGNAEETYGVGLATLLLPVASAIGIVALYFLAGRIRRFGKFTIPDVLEARYGPAARILGVLTLMLAYVIIVSYQYRAGSAVIERIWPGLSPTDPEALFRPAIVLVALFVILYTALAGMFSVAYTDVANGVLMIVGIAITLPLLFLEAGGLEGLHASLPVARFDVFGTYGPMELISVTLPTLLLLLGDANMYQRFFSARDPRSARRSAAWMLVGVLALEIAIILTAFLGYALVQQGKLPAPENHGHIVIQLAFHAVPPFLGAMLVGTVVAIIVSTADSYLLAPSTSFVRDVLSYRLEPSTMERHSVKIGRWVVIGLGLIALGLAFTTKKFFDVALFAYTLYGAGITPPLMAAFFWKRATAAGAAAAIASGVLTAILWNFVIAKPACVTWLGDSGHESLADGVQWAIDNSLDAVIPATIVNVIALVVVSLLTKPDPQKASAI